MSKRNKKLFTASDCGCYIDGAIFRNERQVIEMLISMLTTVSPEEGKKADKEVAAINYSDPESAQALIDTLTEDLQGNTQEGLAWVWEAGDLCLMKDEESNA